MSSPFEKPPPYSPGAPKGQEANQQQPAYAPNPAYPPAQPGYPPQQQGYPPPQQGYAPPPHQGYAPPPQQGYAPPPQQGYAPNQPNVIVVNQQPSPQPVVTTQVITTHVNHQPQVNHCLHCVISLFFWPWIFVWMILCCTEGECC